MGYVVVTFNGGKDVMLFVIIINKVYLDSCGNPIS